MQSKKLIILCGPSGSGKTTIAQQLINNFPRLSFSISATTRTQRPLEKHAKDYHFLNIEEFKKKLAGDEFVESEEVYPGIYYGTLKSELEKIWSHGNIPVLDIDVVGATNIKKKYAPQALTIFVHPVSLDNLKHRLHKRATESVESFSKRIHKAEEELSTADTFDRIVYNEQLDMALVDAKRYVSEYIHENNHFI